MANYPTRNQRIAVGTETTPGTAASTLVTLHQVEFGAPALERRQDARPGLTSDLLPAAGFTSGRKATITIGAPLWVADAAPAAAGIVQIANQLFPLFGACGFRPLPDTSATGPVTTELIWIADTPTGTAHENQQHLTIDYSDGYRTARLTGCRGTFTITCAPGQEMRASFEFMGNLDDDTRLLNQLNPEPAASVQPAVLPPVMQGGSVRVDGQAFTTVSTFTYAQTSTVTHPEDITAPGGYTVPRITSAAPVCNFSFLKTASNPDALTTESFSNRAVDVLANFTNNAGNGSIEIFLPGTVFDVQHTDASELAGQDITINGRSGDTISDVPQVRFTADRAS